MPRGGRRKGAGRKTAWESGCAFAETTVVRVPKYLKDEILDIAHRLDAGEEVDLVSKSLKERNDYLEGRVLELEKKLLNQKQDGKEIVTKSKIKVEQGKLNIDTKSKIILNGTKLSVNRFNLNRAAAAKYKQNNSIEKFAKWSETKDPDNIAWIPIGKGYSPKDNLSDEQLTELRCWIKKNC